MSDSSSSSNGTSQGTSSSTSSPTVVNTAQSNYLLQLAQEADALSKAQYQWGQQQFAKNSQLTDQVVNNFLNGASAAFQQGTTDLGDYNNLFRPENAQLIADANDYASAARIQKNMGSAEAGVQQGMESGRQNAIKDLQSFGIDPSSGRYAALDNAERVQAGAAAAGAGNQAELQTEATGRALRSQAIQVGETIPGQAMNEFNVSNAGNAAAQNARLANSTVGANMLGTPQNYMSTAMGLKLPPVGQNSSGQSQQSSQNSSGSRSNPDPNSNKQQPSKQQPSNGAPRPGGGGSGSGSGAGGQPGGDFSKMIHWNPTDPGGYPTPPDDPGGNTYWDNMPGNAGDDPNAVFPADGGTEPSGDNTGDNTYWDNMAGNAGDDPNAVFPADGGTEPSGDSSGYDNSGDTSGSYDSGSSDSYDSGYDTSGYDTSGDYSDEGDYAQGGPVRPQGPRLQGGIPMTSGGHVPINASPSGGRQTDDVNARLNAGEFVIPKDVAAWEGHKSFQKMITKARQDMSGATAKPQMKQAIPGKTTFASHVLNRTQGMPTNGRG